jgi:transglutaminase-like putative cysteine protease
MRIRVSHDTTFAYAQPTRSIIQNLRLTPRSFDSQYVTRWRVSVDIDATLRLGDDSLGNVVHSLSHARPVERFTVSAVGEVETTDAVGVVRGAVETLPPQMFLRDSAAAQANGALREFASTAIAGSSETLERLHRLMGALHEEMTLDPDASSASRAGAGEALALKKGGARDFAHAFIACARWLNIPARYVSGYALGAEGEASPGLTAWAEALSPGLGWVAFDAVNDVCPSDNYVRVAIGFDALSAAPFRVSHGGGADETVTAAVRVEQAMGQTQN